MEQKKLGVDLTSSDFVFKPVSFDDIIAAVRSNCDSINVGNVYRTAHNIMSERFQEFTFLLARNIDEIVAAANEGREQNDLG